MTPRIGLLLAALLLLGCQAASSATPAPSAGASSAVTVKGQGTADSDPVELSGDYAVTISGDAQDSMFVGMTLRAVHDTAYLPQGLFAETLGDIGPYHLGTNVYGLIPEPYYLDAATMPQGAWTVTFTPR